MTKKRKLSENNENNIVKKTRKDINNIYKFNMYPDNYKPIGYANITKIEEEKQKEKTIYNAIYHLNSIY